MPGTRTLRTRFMIALKFVAPALLAACGAKTPLLVPLVDAHTERDAISSDADAPQDATAECGVDAMPTPERFQWNECETGFGPLCGVLTWDPSRRVFTAHWGNGAIATLTLVEYDDCGIVLERNDLTGSSRGLTARYVGRRQGNTVAGTVTWWWSAWSANPEVHGVWNANW